MNTIKLLDRPIAYHRCLVPVAGSVTAAVFLSQAIYWTNRTTDPEGWFWKTADQWEAETGLTRREQETARKQLKSSEVLEEKLVGVPAILHYRLNLEVLETRLAESAKLDSTKAPNLVGGKRQTICTETTSEITSETLSEREGACAASVEVPPMTKQEWIRTGEMRAWPPDCTEHYWNELEACGWIPEHHVRPMGTKQAMAWMQNRVTAWRAKAMRANGSSTPLEFPGKTEWQREEDAEMRRIDQKIADAKAKEARERLKQS